MGIERTKLMALKVNGNCIAVVDETLSEGVIQRFHLQPTSL
jgi:hypothetical protein